MENTKLRVFISQPMSGVPTCDILNRRNELIDKIENYFETNELKIQDSFFDTENEHVSVKNNSLYWLSRSLEILADSDVIVMATGWENSRGCRIEYECARLYDIMVIFEDTKYITQEKMLEVDNGTAPISE